MNTQTVFKTSVCAQYDELLHACKAVFDDCRKSFQTPVWNGRREALRKQHVERLLEQYEQSYARLVNHFDHCRVCQLSQGPRRKAPRFAAQRHV